MVLKFNDIIYKQTFSIEAKEETLDIVVEISDVESKELGEILKDTKESTRLNEILFKDNLPKLKEILIGYNFSRFVLVVIKDFSDFITGSTLEIFTKKQD